MNQLSINSRVIAIARSLVSFRGSDWSPVGVIPESPRTVANHSNFLLGVNLHELVENGKGCA